MTEQPSYREQLALIRQGLAPKTTGSKPKKAIPKKSPKKIIEDKEKKEAGGDTALDLWFEARRKECTGKCSLCHNKSYKNNNERYRWSIHHLLDKRKKMFPSVALNPYNFLELCHDCHQTLHNGTITYELLRDSAEWNIIRPKLILVLPFVAIEERKNKLYDRLIELIK